MRAQPSRRRVRGGVGGYGVLLLAGSRRHPRRVARAGRGAGCGRACGCGGVAAAGFARAAPLRWARFARVGLVRAGRGFGCGTRIAGRATARSRFGRLPVARDAGGRALPADRRVRGGHLPGAGARCVRSGVGRRPTRHAASGSRVGRAVRRAARVAGRSCLGRRCRRSRRGCAGGVQTRASRFVRPVHGSDVLRNAQLVDARRRARRVQLPVRGPAAAGGKPAANLRYRQPDRLRSACRLDRAPASRGARGFS